MLMDQYLNDNKIIIENLLKNVINEHEVPNSLSESMYYSLLAGGKRLRPVLMLASFDAYSANNREKAYSSALALEMIHTYSLIHDDLPAMDDDDYRRGRLTNHKKYDEATAILAGDALLTDSFSIIMSDDLLTNKEKVFIVKQLSKAAGSAGMVGGQILDMEGEEKQLTVEQLEKIHELKTGKLIEFAVIVGAYLALGDEIKEEALRKYSYFLGLIFQVQDDILDVVGDPDKLGKPVGSDEESDKSTYPNLLGLEGAIKHKEKYVKLAEEALKEAGAETSYLMDLMHHFSDRDH